jgi:hypothetical protein
MEKESLHGNMGINYIALCSALLNSLLWKNFYNITDSCLFHHSSIPNLHHAWNYQNSVPNDLDWSSAFSWIYWFICRYPYLAVVLNFSQTWALYCLIQFYTVTKEKLEPIKPLSKFLTFKSIVFLTWWQGVAVAFLFSTGLFKGHLAQRLQTRIQDYIICLEVCFICHFYPLSWFWLRPFLVPYHTKSLFYRSGHFIICFVRKLYLCSSQLYQIGMLTLIIILKFLIS